MSKTDKTAKVIFIEHNGTEHCVDAKVGASVMQAAINNLVPGIEADCGGLCACATCHGYVDAAWLAKIPPKSQGEAELLQNAPSVHPESRLTCQIQVKEELDGIVIRLPASQY
jgi:2Fe-2S ferredoxin